MNNNIKVSKRGLVGDAVLIYEHANYVQHMSHFEFRCRQVVVSLRSGTLLHIMTLIHVRDVLRKPIISCKFTTYGFSYYTSFLSKTNKGTFFKYVRSFLAFSDPLPPVCNVSAFA